MNPYLKTNLGNTNPPYDDASINKFNAASSNALGYLQNRLNNPIYYQRLQNETMQSNKLGNVTYDPKTGALDLLNQRKKGLSEVKIINPNTADQSEIAIINEIKEKDYLGAFTTGQTGRYEPEYQKEGFMKGALKQDVAGYQKNVIGINPIMFNQDYEKYLENILIHEGEHSTQTAYPDYTNPYYNVGNYNVDNGTLPLYRNLSNITPYATNVIKENISSNDKYYSDPMEVVASKRQIEHLFEKAPEGTFKKSWKYGDDIQDEHFNYFLKGNNNTETEILKKALLGDRTIDELSEEEKKDLKVRFSNIMTKIAYNENNNDNIYTARFGTKVNVNNNNPYLKQYNPGGKVIIDGKEVSTSSQEYKDLYDAGGKVKMDLKTGDMYTYKKGGKTDLTCPPYCDNPLESYERYEEEEKKRDPYNPNNKRIITEGKKTKPINQTLGWNVLEYFDPTGMSSYPDVANTWSDKKFTYNDIVEPLSAIPVLGKIPKIAKGILKGLNIFDTVDDIYNDNLRPILKKIPDMDPIKNFPPKNYGSDDYKSGGDAGHSTVEIERSERVYTPDGKLIMETPADAPTHEEGGVKVTLPEGSLVFPKKYYKALDAASGLPEFKKIAATMLDNAEKAYLRGEPYSSGGKRDKERTYNA